jgi:hypothetical protein
LLTVVDSILVLSEACGRYAEARVSFRNTRPDEDLYARRMGRALHVVALLTVCCCVAASASARPPGAFAKAVLLRTDFDLASNSYDSTLIDSLHRVWTDCSGASAASHNRRINFELEVDSALRQSHDAIPFAHFAAHVAALPDKPAPLAALARLYLKEADLVRPLASQSPSNAQERASLICSLYRQWGRHGWSMSWINHVAVREYATAHIPWNAAPRIAHSAIALLPALQRAGATHEQALALTSLTLTFG